MCLTPTKGRSSQRTVVDELRKPPGPAYGEGLTTRFDCWSLVSQTLRARLPTRVPDACRLPPASFDLSRVGARTRAGNADRPQAWQPRRTFARVEAVLAVSVFVLELKPLHGDPSDNAQCTGQPPPRHYPVLLSRKSGESWN